MVKDKTAQLNDLKLQLVQVMPNFVKYIDFLEAKNLPILPDYSSLWQLEEMDFWNKQTIRE